MHQSPLRKLHMGTTCTFDAPEHMNQFPTDQSVSLNAWVIDLTTTWRFITDFFWLLFIFATNFFNNLLLLG